MCSDKSLQGSQSHDLMATSCCPIRLRILVVDHDAEFLAFISGLLKLLRHEVETYRYPIEALSTLWIEDKKFDLVMADIYLHDMDGLQLLKKVREYNLPLIMVSDDNSESAILAALQHGASHYIVKPVCFSDVKNLWQLVMAANRERPSLNILVEHIGSVRGESSSSTNGENNCSKKRKSKEGKSTCVSKKKHKVEWNSQLQARFLEAVNYIGLEKAVPKRILQVMNVAGLTRENVASHLQKYRMFLRKVAAKIATSKLSVDRARNTRRALLYQDLTGQRRTFRDNLQLSVSLNYSASLSRLGRCSHDHEASSSRSPSVPQSRQPYLPKAGSNFSKQPLMMSSTSTPNPFQPATNFSGFQSNNGQRNWSASTPISAEVFYNLGRNNSSGVKIGSNPLMQQSPQPFTTNNYGPSAGIDNPNYASWNGNNVGSLAGNNNSNLMISGIQRRTSTRIAASGGGFVPLMDQNQMVSNGGSATSNDANNNVSSNHNFGYLMMNNGTRNDDYSMYNNVSPIGSSMLGPEGFGGSSSSQLLSSPIFAGGNNNNNNNNSIGQENVDVSAFDDPVLQQQQQQQCGSSDLVGSSNNSSSTITVVESGSSSSDISSYLKDAEDDDKFCLSHDIFLNENQLKSVTNDKGKGKKVMNSDQDTDKNYDLSDNFWNENRSESANNDQGKGKHVMNSDQSTDEEFDLSDMFLNELHLGPANSDHKGKGKQVMNSDPNASHEVQDADPLKEEPLAQQCPADINYMDLEFHADGLNFVDTPSLENLSLNEDWGSLWRQCSSDWHE